MAIKGKGRTRSRRMVAAPPRPQLVVRKKPVLVRRSTWVVVGLIAVGAIAFGVIRWSHDRATSRLLDRERIAIQKLDLAVTNQLPADRSTPQGTNDVTVFPTLAQTLDQIEKGTLSGTKGRSAAKAAADQAKKAAAGLQGVAVTSIVSDEFTVGETPDLTAKGMTRFDLNEAQALMVDSFQLYQSIGGLMTSALDQPDRAKRTAIVEEAKREQTVAAGLFGRGYGKLVQIKSILGLLPPAGLAPSP